MAHGGAAPCTNKDFAFSSLLACTSTGEKIVYGFAGLHPPTLEQHQLTPLTKLFDKLEPIAFPTMPHIEFFPHRDILFHQHEWLEEHPNGLKFELQGEEGILVTETYFSIGGGFIQTK